MVVAVIVRMILATKRRADQFAIRKAFLIVDMTGGRFGWHGVERIFQVAPPAHTAAEYATTLEPVIVGPEVKTEAYGITAGRG